MAKKPRAVKQEKDTGGRAPSRTRRVVEDPLKSLIARKPESSRSLSPEEVDELAEE